MSLGVANSIARSALSTAQYQMSVAAANIANADTEGYTRKTAASTAVTTNGIAAGVTAEKLTSIVDKLLSKQLVSSASAKESAAQIADFTDQLQSLYGETTSSDDSGTSLASLLDDLTTALSNLETTPESQSLQTIALSAMETLASGISDLSDGIQALREDADQSIASAVETANINIEAIHSYNQQITTAKANGQSTADLEDKRAQALLELSSVLDVRWSVSDNGTMSVYTGDGSKALVNSSAHTLSFDSAGYVSSDTTYPGGLSGISVDGKDITSSISSGSIAGLLTMRDETLVAAQQELDTLASTVISKFNAISNESSASPAPTSLTGTAQSSLSDAFSGTGVARIAIVSEDGTLSSYADFDLSNYATVGDLVTAINQTSGIAASLNSEGELVLTSEDSTKGIALAAMTSSIGANGQNLSSYFGMNDLFTGDDASSISINSKVSSSSGLLPVAKLDSSSSLTAGSVVLSSGDQSVSSAYSALLTDNLTFAASGGLSAKTSTLTDYVSAIISDKANQTSASTSKADTTSTKYDTLVEAKASKSGVNLDEETEKLTELQQLYEAAAQIISTATSMFDALLEAVK